jgi:hypothetical protein
MNIFSKSQLTPTESLRSCGRLALLDGPGKKFGVQTDDHLHNHYPAAIILLGC